MGETFFNTSERIATLQHEAGLWLNTPFVSHACIRGAGVDCVHLVADIYIKCGVIEKFSPPKYSLDGGSHNKQSQLLAWLDAHSLFEKIEDGRWKPGDVLCFNLGLSEHHAALLIGGKSGADFIHVLPRRKVILSSLAEQFYRRRITAAYRPLNLQPATLNLQPSYVR